MKISSKAKTILANINEETKLGDLRKIAKEIKKDHELAMELWSSNQFLPRQLAILIMDKKLLTQELIDQLDADIMNHTGPEQNQLMDWLMANQLSKDKKTIALLDSWKDSPSELQRRSFWYYQGRKRWMGKTDQTDTKELLKDIAANLAKEKPKVQWAMNFTACQIGKWQEEYRDECIAIGEKNGLYKDEIVHKGCTPNYIPGFISVELAKLNKK